jgi:DNA polymerase-3 subunit delta
MRDLKNKVYSPVYCLMGEEAYYIDKISDYIEHHVLDEAEKSFNQTVVYGNESDVSSIIDSAKRYPMMSNYQVVMIKEAQNLKKIEALESYVDNPLDSTILVLCYKYKSLDKRKSFTKKVIKNGIVFESKKLYENQVPDWINGYVKQKKHTINPPATMMLSEYLGNDLSKIANEIDKTIINIEAGAEITKDLIEKYVGISKDFNFFELNDAISSRNILKVNKIINYFAKNPKDHPFVLSVGMLFSFFSKVLAYHFTTDKSKNNLASVLKINPFFVKDYQLAAQNFNPKKTVHIIELLREYDLKSKGVNNVSASDGELLKELTFKILH